MAYAFSTPPSAHGCTATDDAAAMARAPTVENTPHVASPPRPVALRCADGG
jgi:hypothetical protein